MRPRTPGSEIVFSSTSGASLSPAEVRAPHAHIAVNATSRIMPRFIAILLTLRPPVIKHRRRSNHLPWSAPEQADQVAGPRIIEDDRSWQVYPPGTEYPAGRGRGRGGR